MFFRSDTIAAVSSAAVAGGEAGVSIIRVSGPGAFENVERLLCDCSCLRVRGIFNARVKVGTFSAPASVYVFPSPHSYTGQDLIELHLEAAGCVAEEILRELSSKIRLAEPGEFTYRAYVNGRMDLSQAEAVAQIVSGSNIAQVSAAERLLNGNLSAKIAAVRERILELLSLLEAGMDFAEEDIEFVSAGRAIEMIGAAVGELKGLLGGPIQYERMIDMPSVGIAGAVNAGKSSLANALLGRPRSIVSSRPAATRDVLLEILPLEDLDCVLFDCAGLAASEKDAAPLDIAARQAAQTALVNADLIVFCSDVSKLNFDEDYEIFSELPNGKILTAAAQCDRVQADQLPEKLGNLEKIFKRTFLPTSSLTKLGLQELKKRIQKALLEQRDFLPEADRRIGLNRRHSQIVEEAIRDLAGASGETAAGNAEIASMLLRSAWTRLGGIEREDVEEALLEKIFSRFCIGK